MKKILLSIAVIFYATCLMAQHDAVIQLFVTQKQYEKAKMEVDYWLSQPNLGNKEKSSAYLWQLLVYGHLYSDLALSSKYPNSDQQALRAFNNYQALDPGLKQLKEQHFEEGLANIDQGYLIRGNSFWDNKQYDSAFKYFSQSYKIRHLLYDNRIIQMDTEGDQTLITFIASAAEQSKQYDAAAAYYAKLADMKVSGPDNEGIYKFLITYAINNKDDAAVKKYLATAKEIYPNDNSLWTQYEMSNMTANTALMDLLQKYQQDVAAGGMNEDKLLSYADAFATNDKAQLESLDSTQKITLKLAAAQAFSKAFELNNTNGLYAFNSGVIYYGIYNDLDDRYHANAGAGAALKAKRTEIAKQRQAYADTASQWFERAYPVLKAKTNRTSPETSSLNRTVDYLANIYYWERDQTKVNGNSKDYDKYDAMYKKYDAEHNTYLGGTQNNNQVNNNYNDLNNSFQNSPSENVSVKGRIQLRKSNGVYLLNVKVNDELHWEMIYDTGASNVSISLLDALYMKKQGLLSPEEILDEASYQTADGSVSTGYTIILRKIDIGGGIILYNVRATVVNSLDAPLLLGQSALEKFNTITLDKANSLLIIK